MQNHILYPCLFCMAHQSVPFILILFFCGD
uniref:Uncharacterized protein n=1 Tax=Rhizophora mucronata TaxID=61149 RepID=A0A2P2MXV5_RHIMU